MRDGFYWGTVESILDQYQFNQDYRDKMIRLGQNQVQMIGALGLNNPLYDQNSTPYTDEGRTAFANYIAGGPVVDQYCFDDSCGCLLSEHIEEKQ
ncbi:hypothetical protein GC096_02350 [Paenibacillus sp. LMG 31461]|uniref:Uncharacterized protein n=1 Tax=Paenibacillus plantarum TaxID=2654975 RepID=A0ABX1X3S0_9BACL|nr:hypothetical protein [Paenibacillus plantarum]NOU62886.1 hypothetical protein [Paenibacillus plantarum]